MQRLSGLALASMFATRLTLAGTVIAVIATAMVYMSLVSAPGTIGFLGAGLALVALAIAVIDGRSFVIPDGLNVAGASLALLHAAVQEPGAMPPAVALAALRRRGLAPIFVR